MKSGHTVWDLGAYLQEEVGFVHWFARVTDEDHLW